MPLRSKAPPPGARRGADGLVEDLKAARHELMSTRHPTYHRVLGILIALIADPATGEALLLAFERMWKSRSFPTFYERPLLILAALRADALQEGPSHPLYAALAAPTPDPNVLSATTVANAFARDRLGIWSTMATRRVQTNDTSRAIAWLWPAYLAGCDSSARPLSLVDIGASAGLNLIGDQLPPIWTDSATGKPIPCATQVNTVARLGFDSRPLDVRNDDDVLWLRSCVWPGETARLARFEASVRALRAHSSAKSPVVVERLSAALVPKRLTALAAGMSARTLLIAYQTLVSGYLDATERENYRSEMLAFILHPIAGRALWVELELNDARRRLPAVLVAHFRAHSEVRSLTIARANQHPTELEVDTAAVTELRKHLAR